MSGAARPGLSALARPALLVTGLIGAGLLLRSLPGDFSGRAAAQGPLAFVLLGAAACAVGVPRQAAAFAGGYAYGLWAGGALALLAQALGCLTDLAWSRAVARDWAQRRIGPRLRRLDGFLAAHPFSATLTLRLLPVGNNVALNLLVGVSALPAAPFLGASILGYAPQTVVFALLGAGVHLGRSVQVGVGLLLFAGSTLLGLALLRRHRRTADPDAA